MTPLIVQLFKCIQCFISIAYRIYFAELTAQWNLFNGTHFPHQSLHGGSTIAPAYAAIWLSASPATWPLHPVAFLLLFTCKLFGNKLLLYWNQEAR